MNVPPEEIIHAIGPDDVVMGRGKSSLRHDGNVKYRQIIHAWHEEYCAVPDRRNAIAEKIMRTVKSRGGRFLRQISVSRGQGQVECWVRCAESVVRTKVKQALRDVAKQARSGLSTSPAIAPLSRSASKASDDEDREGEMRSEAMAMPEDCSVPGYRQPESSIRRDVRGKGRITGIWESRGSLHRSSDDRLHRGLPPFLPESHLSIIGREHNPQPMRSGRGLLIREGTTAGLLDPTPAGGVAALGEHTTRKRPWLLTPSGSVMARTDGLPGNLPPRTIRPPFNMPRSETSRHRNMSDWELLLMLRSDPTITTESTGIARTQQATQLRFDDGLRGLTGHPHVCNDSAIYPSEFASPNERDRFPAALRLVSNKMTGGLSSSADATLPFDQTAQAAISSATVDPLSRQREGTHVPSVAMSRCEVLRRYLRQEQDLESSFLTPSELTDLKLELRQLEEDEAHQKHSL